MCVAVRCDECCIYFWITLYLSNEHCQWPEQRTIDLSDSSTSDHTDFSFPFSVRYFSLNALLEIKLSKWFFESLTAPL